MSILAIFKKRVSRGDQILKAIQNNTTRRLLRYDWRFSVITIKKCHTLRASIKIQDKHYAIETLVNNKLPIDGVGLVISIMVSKISRIESEILLERLSKDRL